MGFIRGKEKDGGYEPPLIHKLLKPKNITGNEINGLGESEDRRPTPIYHWFGKMKTPFYRVNWILILSDVFNRTATRHIKRSLAFEKKPHTPVPAQKVEMSPGQWSDAIKAVALKSGADLVGIRKMRPEWVFDGFQVKEKWIIVLGFQMNYEELSKLPAHEGGEEVLKVYADGQGTAWEVAEWIQTSGWHAKGFCGPMASPVTTIPPALAAGFGELGKHGSIINRKLGANLRLAYVLTDIPALVEDGVDEFGVDDFCSRCQVCTKNCPPGAITENKQLVRGVEKWYVDFDKCIPYFNEHFGCGVCIAVCPWSRPGIADNLLTKLAKQKERKAQKKRKEQIENTA